MGRKTIQGSLALAATIRERREELNLTLEEAANKAGIGTKTWSRYESGDSIREDKCMSICKALDWDTFPETYLNDSCSQDLTENKAHKAWSDYLFNSFGKLAAVSFAEGSDILLDYIADDLQELSYMPKNTHIGQISTSFLKDSLPEQFLMEYDYEFLYLLRTNVQRFRTIAHMGNPIITHSVLDELTLYLIVEEYCTFLGNDEASDNWNEWIFDVFDDMDIITFLFSGQYLSSEHPYHLCHWLENKFFTEID